MAGSNAAVLSQDLLLAQPVRQLCRCTGVRISSLEDSDPQRRATANTVSTDYRS